MFESCALTCMFRTRACERSEEVRISAPCSRSSKPLPAASLNITPRSTLISPRSTQICSPLSPQKKIKRCCISQMNGARPPFTPEMCQQKSTPDDGHWRHGEGGRASICMFCAAVTETGSGMLRTSGVSGTGAGG